MGKKKTSDLYPIGQLAAAAGVTTQTIRMWEKRGQLSATRSSGGQRLFSREMLKRATSLSAASRRIQHQQGATLLASGNDIELASTGMRIRRARIERGLSQQEAAERMGISRSFLSTVERGASGVSTQVLAKMADALDIAMSGFAGARDPSNRVMRVADRPRTTLTGGVFWEELIAPSSHDLEPALLNVPPGCDSGGTLVRPGESFVFLLKGSLAFRSGEHLEESVLLKGDAIVLDSGTPFSWENPGKSMATCLWVELIGSVRKRAPSR